MTTRLTAELLAAIVLLLSLLGLRGTANGTNPAATGPAAGLDLQPILEAVAKEFGWQCRVSSITSDLSHLGAPAIKGRTFQMSADDRAIPMLSVTDYDTPETAHQALEVWLNHRSNVGGRVVSAGREVQIGGLAGRLFGGGSAEVFVTNGPYLIQVLLFASQDRPYNQEEQTRLETLAQQYAEAVIKRMASTAPAGVSIAATIGGTEKGADTAAPPIPPSGTTPEELASIISTIDRQDLAGTPEAGLIISLARTACYGSCPIYAVSVCGDGTVNYRGIGFVRVKGDVTYHVSPSTVIALADELKEGGYGDLPRRSKDCGMATDHPSANMSLTRNGSTLKYDHDHGDFCAPAKLAVFEDRIDAVLNTKVLVECPDKGCAP
jgi:hypothetical protein